MKLIDGEKLIEDLRRYKHEVISVDGLEGIISLMPSAEPYTEKEIQKMQELEQAEIEKAYELGRHKMSDLISRQSAIEEVGTDTNIGDMISRQEAIDWLTNEWDGMVTSVFDGIKNLPSAESERKKGKWMLHEDGWYCSVCELYTPFDCDPEEKGIPYCPNCGAKMEVTDEETDIS